MIEYKPREGGTADLAIKHLARQKPDQQWMALTRLSDEIDVDYGLLVSSLATPIQKGLVRKFKFDGSMCVGLVNDKRPEGATAAAEKDPPPLAVSAESAAALQSVASTWGGGERRVAAVEPEVERRAPPAEPKPQEPEAPLPQAIVVEREHFGAAIEALDIAASKDTFACALISDGRFMLEQDGSRLMLRPENAERMLGYIERFWRPEA
jgi:hypothetical protein